MIIYEKLQYELNRAATKHFEVMRNGGDVGESVRALSVAAEAYTLECARMSGKTLDEFFEDVACDEERTWYKDMYTRSNGEMLDKLQKAAKGVGSQTSVTESSPALCDFCDKTEFSGGLFDCGLVKICDKCKAFQQSDQLVTESSPVERRTEK